MRIRRRARIIAIQALYELDLTDHPPAVVIAQRIEDEAFPSEGIPFVQHLVSGVLQYKQYLEQKYQDTHHHK